MEIILQKILFKNQKVILPSLNYRLAFLEMKTNQISSSLQHYRNIA
jgi:hypothetical protein